MPVEIKIAKHSKAPKASEKAPDLAAKAAADKPGYANPPKQHQWKPGQSGNPSGKPKGAKSLATVITEEAKGKVTIKDANGKTKKLSKTEAIVRTAVHKALKGDTKSMAMVLALFKEHLPKDTGETLQVATQDEMKLIQDHTAMLALLNEITSETSNKTE